MPSIDFVKVNRGQQHGNSTVRLAELLCEFRELVRKMSAASGRMNDGNDYTLMEQMFGLQAGQGQVAATLLGNLNTIFNTPTDVTGAQRFQRINEFCDRFAGQ